MKDSTAPASAVPFQSPAFAGITIHRYSYIRDDETEEVTSGEHWELPEEMRSEDPKADYCERCGRLLYVAHDALGRCRRW
jgi:hypothetical protein